jgi:hypothetical protein
VGTANAAAAPADWVLERWVGTLKPAPLLPGKPPPWRLALADPASFDGSAAGPDVYRKQMCYTYMLTVIVAQPDVRDRTSMYWACQWWLPHGCVAGICCQPLVDRSLSSAGAALQGSACAKVHSLNQSRCSRCRNCHLSVLQHIRWTPRLRLLICEPKNTCWWPQHGRQGTSLSSLLNC